MIKIIVATAISDDTEGVIGIRGVNKLLWRSATDMKFFKKTTEGSVVVMGNNTFKSIGKPLPNRTNVILSKSEKPGERNGVYYYNSINEIIKEFPEFNVIGGEEIYSLFLPVADQVFLTSLSLDIRTDGELVYFPIDKMEEDFYLDYESDIIQDIDEESGLPINLIFTRWVRGVEQYH